MNFLDTYEITGSNTPPRQPEQSLNEEVTQVIGQLGRFWGGFRKQSQTALEAARKDFGDVVTQAQKELGKLTEQPTAGESSSSTASGSEAQDGPEAGSSTEGDTTPRETNETERPNSPQSQSFFTRLQSSLPPNIVSTIQSQLPDTLKNASQNIDLAQLRTNLSSEFQRVQGLTRAQAEEYVHKSEGMLREAMREAGEVLKDAVKVIPPEEGGSSAGLVWDGTDVWMLPSPSGETVADGKGKGKQADAHTRRASDTQRSVATRAESLLKQLKYDPAVIRADPEAEESIKEMYTAWIKDEIESQEGGLESKVWKDRLAAALNEPGDGAALQATHDVLVPTEITEDVFWKRYSFRVHQVETEEEKRKALLQRVENDEEFSWEDDEEEGSASTPLSKNKVSLNASTSSEQTLGLKPDSAKHAKAPSSQADTSASTSPRLSSEDSFDLVSSGNVSTAGDAKPPAKKNEKEQEDEEDADSDWE